MTSYGSTEPSIGLSSAEAARRLAEFGPNELEAAETDSFFKVAVRQMFNLIFLLTSLSAIICYGTGDYSKANFLVCLVFFIWLFNSVGEYSGQDAGAALKAMAPEAAEVYRDGNLQKVPVRDIVIGDVVQVKTGSVVPADMKVLESVELQTNESVLTGEPKEKNKISASDMSTPLEEAEGTDGELPPCMLYKQTEVVAGRGTCEVTATGMHTRVGIIAERLKHPELTKNEDKDEAPVEVNPLQKSINQLGTILLISCATVITIATIAAYVLNYIDIPQVCAIDDKMCIFWEAIIRGLLMATAIVPHGLPLVVMVMLRVGAQLMAEENALVMRKSAVDYLGATQIICTDKTGTLTAGVMASKLLISIARVGNSTNLTQSSFYPLKGLDPQGGIFVTEELSSAEEKQLDAGKSPDELKIANLGNPEAKVSDKSVPTALITRASLTAAFVNCHACKITPPKFEGDKWTSEGSTTDAALKVAAWKGGLVDNEPKGVDTLSLYKNQEHLELPFSSSRKMSATVHKLPVGGGGFAGIQLDSQVTHLAILKGAPDRILPSLTGMLEVQSGKLILSTNNITDEEKARIADQNDGLARQALRSILMAVKPLTDSDVNALAEIKGQVDARLKILLGPGLVFLSLWGIFDPPRPSVPPSVRLCHQAGIRVVMITGDQQPTAVAIGKLVGIIPPGADAKMMSLPCAELHQKSINAELRKQVSRDKMTAPVKAAEAEYKDVGVLVDMTSKVNVWSRAQPTDKVAIVDSLSYQEYIASMTGDGVNDAPALKRADIGVAMGISGTAVTKNAADMILMDDNFSTIVAAVAEGRKIYGNVQKYVLFNLSVKGSECFCCLLAIFAGLPLPISGLPQLVNLVITHIIPPMALAWEDAEDYTMKIKPRKTKGDLVLNKQLMTLRWLPYVFSYGIILCLLSVAYLWMETGFYTIRGLISTSSALLVDQQQHACQVAGAINANGKFEADAVPFHCLCTMRSSYWDSTPSIVDQWGVWDPSEATINRWNGDTSDDFDLENTPWAYNGLDEYLKTCNDKDGNVHLCWKNPEANHPLLDVSTNCAAWGSRIALSMAYASIQLTEILTLITFRTDGPFFSARRSNVYFGMLAFNLCGLMVVLYVPIVTDFLTLAPLTAVRLFLCFAAPILMLIVCELSKGEFRVALRRSHELDSPNNFKKKEISEV